MVDFTKKIKSSDKFRQPALEFLKTGQYCQYPKGTSEYINFWTEEQNRCINGYTADDGDFISGYNYFYLNYCPILRIVNKKVNGKTKSVSEVTFPDFWDYDYYYFQTVEEAQLQGKHLCVLKSRRRGYSYKAASMMCRNYYLIPNTSSYVYASNKQYLTDDGVLTKAWNYMDFIDEYTAWGKKRTVNTQLRRRAGMWVKDEYGNQIEVGYKSEIIGVTLKDNPDVGHPYDQIVYTPEGRKLWKDITVGSQLFDSRGGITTVTEVNELGEVPVYRITLNNGRTVEATSDHKWRIFRYRHKQHSWNGKNEKKEIREIELTTQQLFQLTQNKSYKTNRCRIKVRQAVPFNEQFVPIDAYTMGFLLGDGSLTKTSNHKAYFVQSAEDYESIKHLFPYKIDKQSGITYAVNIPNAKQLIKQLDLLDKTSKNKFIPDCYKYNSTGVRLAILNGLLDTDGSVTKDYGVIEYVSKSRQLAQDVSWILFSLGMNNSIHTKYIKGVPYYRVYIYCSGDDDRLFCMPRKKERIRIKKLTPFALSKVQYTYIDKVEHVGNKVSKCVTVNAEDHVYMIGDFIETKNCRGKRANLILFEEAGSFKELSAAWQIARPSVEIDGKAFATMIAYGTGGDEACITENNYVYTSSGEMISIKELSNQKLLGFDLDNKCVTEEPVTHINKPTVKECVKLITNTGRAIECSIDHPILASNKKDSNDCLQFEWIDAGDISVGNYVATCKSINCFGSETIPNPRAIGLFIGDGSYRDKSSVRLTSCDEEVKSYIRSLYPCSTISSYTTKDGRLCEQLLVKKAKYDINKVGINGQTKECKRLPDNIFNCDKNTICELLAGLYDTDGCITISYNKKRNKYSTVINLTQLSLTLLQQVLLLLQKLGIHGYIYKVKSKLSASGVVKHIKENSYYYSLDIHDVDSIREFQRNIKLLVKYKQDRLNEAILKLANVRCLRKDRGYVYERVVEKHYVGEKTVYNITAGNTNTYVVNGIITHNSNFFTLKDMFYHPEGYNCLGLPNIWDENVANTECGFFVPQYTNMDLRDEQGKRLYMDDDGNTLTFQARQYILEERRKVIEHSTSSVAIDRYVAERPITPAEACLEFNGNIFPKKELQEQLAKIRTNKALQNRKQVGDLVWEQGGNLKWLIKKNGDITHYPLNKNDDPTGSIVIWEHPVKDPPIGLYIIGVDPYDHDQSGTNSLGSCFVYKRFQNFEEYYDLIVAEYTGRPSTAEEFYENVRKLAIYYNARIMYENQNKGLFPYFVAKHCDYLLADQPDILNDIISSTKVNRKKGCHMTKQIKQWGEGLIKDWLNEEKAPGHKNLHDILSEPLLEELIAYNDIGNFDRVCSLIQVMIYREQLYNIVVKEKKKQNKSRLLFDGPIFSQDTWYDDTMYNVDEDVYTFN